MEDANNRVKASLLALLAMGIVVAGAEVDRESDGGDALVPCAVAELMLHAPFVALHPECIPSHPEGQP